MGRGPLQFFKTKVAMALIGTILIGGTSAVLAARTVNEGSLVQTTNALTTNSNSTGSGQPVTSTSTSTASQATAQATAGGGNGNQPTPTTPVSPPTRVPTPTPAPGQTINFSGSVISINSGAMTFVVRNRSGSTRTIDANGSTTFTGSATSFATLQVGMHVQGTCTVQGDYSCLPNPNPVSTSSGDN